jgi:hypothetical protein
MSLLAQIFDEVTGWNAVQFKPSNAFGIERLADSSEFFRVSSYRRH